MKVYMQPIGLYSKAMLRVMHALQRYAPNGVEFTTVLDDADFHIVHVIGTGSIEGLNREKPYAVIQYCLQTAGATPDFWQALWNRSEVTWSYYDLGDFSYFYAPLGVDFPATEDRDLRHIGVMTSGYVSGPTSEAIEEVAIAASRCGLKTLHLGPPNVEGMALRPIGWSSIMDIDDRQLAQYYRATAWVSGLRHVEGFELPVLEGFVNGARPIVFDRAETRRWFDGIATFVPECSGEELIGHLVKVFMGGCAKPSVEERQLAAQRFHWEPIATGFWDRAVHP